MVGIGFESIWKVGGFKSFPKTFDKWESVEGSWLTMEDSVAISGSVRK
jgi:hypothetical protein